MKNLFLILFCLYSSANFSEESCQEFLIRRAAEHGVSPKELFWATQRWFKEKFNLYPSKASMHFGRAAAALVEPMNKGKDVISFGSGPDIFTPLISFPTAQNIHLVDLLGGWGEGSGRVLWEIIQRARAIHPTSEVKISRWGFVAAAPNDFRRKLSSSLRTKGIKSNPEDDDFSSFKFWEDNYSKAESFRKNLWMEPFIVQVKWEQDDLGPMKKYIFVHPIDFNNSEMIKHLETTVANEKLGGVVITGSAFPNKILSFLYQLEANASAVLEVYSDYPDQEALIQLLDQMPYFNVELVNMETFIRWGESHKVKQKLYVVKRVPSF